MATQILYRSTSGAVITPANYPAFPVKNETLFAWELDANFKSIQDNKAERDGTNAVENSSWAINITKNAATATKLSTVWTNWSTNGTVDSVVGLLAWKNYGNSHVIFDASAATNPTGGAISNTDAQVPWSASYPILMGWNGTNTYGLRVDSAREANFIDGGTY